MRFRAGHGAKGEEDFTLSLTPLIDVVFLLLIFFMVSTAFIDFTKRLDIQLPDSNVENSTKQVKNIVIEMDIKKRVYLNSKRVSVKQLEQKLKTYVGSGVNNTVLIRADKALPYGEIIKLMSICREAKIHDIGVAVK